MLLSSDDGTCLAGSLHDSLLVEGFERVHVEHAGPDAFLRQHVGSFHTVCHGLAAPDQRDVIALA